MEELIRHNAGGEKVTAVFVASDVQAIGALQAADDLGVRVPEDLAVVSFDDIELAQHAHLTTMRQPMHAMGMLALERLHARLKNPLSPPTATSFLPELIIRDTCGAALKHVEIHPQITHIELEAPSSEPEVGRS
jgi:LacI family transcriptional regulator